MFRHVNAVANIWIPVAKNEENMRVDCVFGPEFFFFFFFTETRAEDRFDPVDVASFKFTLNCPCPVQQKDEAQLKL